jgi:hypothetical protein
MDNLTFAIIVGLVIVGVVVVLAVMLVREAGSRLASDLKSAMQTTRLECGLVQGNTNRQPMVSCRLISDQH